MDIDNDVSTVLSTLRLETESPELVHIIYQLEDFYERKLWNQLSLALEELYSFPESKDNGFRSKIFTQFLSTFQKNLNPIKLVDFLLQSFEDPQQCLNQLQELKTSMVADLNKKLSSRKLDNLDQIINDEDFIVYINLQIARYSLLLNNLPQAEEILESLTSKFESTLQNEYSSQINAAFYLTRCQYYKIHQNYNKFYTNGLLYLSSIETPLLPEEKVAFCYDLCVAALLGDKIYNFGELILHDILTSISSSDSEYFWLYNLIQYLNAGNLKKFDQTIAECKEKTPLLAHHQDFLHQKIVIMSLLELISVKLTTSKMLLFKEISSVTGTPENDVEFLIIKCFSLNLIKGSINQIDQVLLVTWLQPRILNLDQVKTLYDHLVDWDSRVEKLAHEVHKNGGTVWADV